MHLSYVIYHNPNPDVTGSEITFKYSNRMDQQQHFLIESEELISLSSCSGSSCEYAGRGGNITAEIRYHILEERVCSDNGSEIAEKLSCYGWGIGYSGDGLPVFNNECLYVSVSE